MKELQISVVPADLVERLMEGHTLRVYMQDIPCKQCIKRRMNTMILLLWTSDPLKEPPLTVADTVISILAEDYPVEKVSCYVSDDGSSMHTFDSLAGSANFVRKWVPSCKKFSVERVSYTIL